MNVKNFIISSFCCLALTATTLLCACSREYTVTIRQVINNNLMEDSSYSMTVERGSEITFTDYIQARYDGIPPLTGMQNTGYFYTDALCRIKFTGTIENDITLYFGEYTWAYFGEVSFYFEGEEYLAYRRFGETLSADDFAVSAYGYGDADDYTFWSDEACTIPLDIVSTTVPEDDITIYVTRK